MSEFAFVEKPFLDQLAALDWTVIYQSAGIPADPTKSLRTSFREVTLRDEFNQAVRAINTTEDGKQWLFAIHMSRFIGQTDNKNVPANPQTWVEQARCEGRW